jgi:small subunit ribosomal protein S4
MVIRAKEKKERALGEKLFLKAHRCNSPKCAMLRRPNRPGVHTKPRRKVSDYGNQLNAKQKFKLSYGVNEKQLTSLFKESARSKESTGEKIVQMLERRLDNAIFRSGLADSRIMARHFVVRGHFMVNGKKTVSPSYLIRTGDVIAIRPESKSKSPFKEAVEILKKFSPPAWLTLDSDKLEAKVNNLPHGIEPMFNIGAVVEYFAKNN